MIAAKHVTYQIELIVLEVNCPLGWDNESHAEANHASCYDFFYRLIAFQSKPILLKYWIILGFSTVYEYVRLKWLATEGRFGA